MNGSLKKVMFDKMLRQTHPYSLLYQDLLLFIWYFVNFSLYVRVFWLSSLYMMRCAIWYHLHNFKNVKNTHGGVLHLVKLQALACNSTKSKLLHECFSRFWNCTNGTKARKASHIVKKRFGIFCKLLKRTIKFGLRVFILTCLANKSSVLSLFQPFTKFSLFAILPWHKHVWLERLSKRWQLAFMQTCETRNHWNKWELNTRYLPSICKGPVAITTFF